MPFVPSKITSKGKREVHICPICDSAIKDSAGKRVGGQDAVECSGSCAIWLHKHCTGLSKQAFEEVNRSSVPFNCPQCRLDRQEIELKSLREIVCNLASELKALKSCLHPAPPTKGSGMSYSDIAQNGSAQSDETASTTPGHPQHSGSQSTPVMNNRNQDQHYSLVISGIAECEPSVRRPQRQSQDLRK